MTQEHRELLLKDLSGRFPSKVFVEDENAGLCVLQSYMLNDLMFEESSDVKPYLRPMESMTDEEREDWYRESNVDYDPEFKPDPTVNLEDCHLSVDWLNAHYFDYRGLIPLGLALTAPEGMYDSK